MKPIIDFQLYTHQQLWSIIFISFTYLLFCGLHPDLGQDVLYCLLSTLQYVICKPVDTRIQRATVDNIMTLTINSSIRIFAKCLNEEVFRAWISIYNPQPICGQSISALTTCNITIDITLILLLLLDIEQVFPHYVHCCQYIRVFVKSANGVDINYYNCYFSIYSKC